MPHADSFCGAEGILASAFSKDQAVRSNVLTALPHSPRKQMACAVLPKPICRQAGRAPGCCNSCCRGQTSTEPGNRADDSIQLLRPPAQDKAQLWHGTS